MVDLLTVIPIWARYFGATTIYYTKIDSLTDALVFVLYGLNTTRILRALRIRRMLLLIEDGVDRCLGDIFLNITMTILFGMPLDLFFSFFQ